MFGLVLRRIEQATGVRRETAGDYLSRPGSCAFAGKLGEKSLAKAATLVTTGSDAQNQATIQKRPSK